MNAPDKWKSILEKLGEVRKITLSNWIKNLNAMAFPTANEQQNGNSPYCTSKTTETSEKKAGKCLTSRK